MSADELPTDERTMTLEAFADTIIPGEKRTPQDRAIAGACEGGGAVAAGAVELLDNPSAGLAAGLEPLTQGLNALAAEYAEELGVELDSDVPAFVALSYEQRTALVQRLTTPGRPDKDGWASLAMFTTMAYDSAAHLPTAEAIAAGHPGLAAMGFSPPGPDGKWRYAQYSYGRQLAESLPDTTPSGSPA